MVAQLHMVDLAMPLLVVEEEVAEMRILSA